MDAISFYVNAIGKLKELGNSILGNFGMSLDNFKMEQDKTTGSWSIRCVNISVLLLLCLLKGLLDYFKDGTIFPLIFLMSCCYLIGVMCSMGK